MSRSKWILRLGCAYTIVLAFCLSSLRGFSFGERVVRVKQVAVSATFTKSRLEGVVHRNLSNPIVNMNSADFGRIVSAGMPRTMQFGARFTF